MRGFRRERGAFVAELDAQEREVVASVVADVAELLGAARFEDGPPPATGHPDPLGLRIDEEWVAPPEDAAVRRLLPDASREDPAVAAEFRRLTEGDLRRTKIGRLAAVWQQLTADDGGALVVRPQDAQALAATLTDLRLVLAERLGIVDEEAADALYDELEADVAEDDAAGQARQYLASVYAALSWLQESLLAVMLEDLRRRD
ncbi:DUF2017 domain-containing protein [Cellulomonas cellasea]|uniref:DUF2017 domain-containing protein n=1 Tax=Cellulomonas cellasea TaxID=43670 RepID=A0A7W4UF81_9CELL|nr:DUF2017 domain-containing protein [Cellulomonas cellasea]MBB2923076.1 hypothetical protein [Cellulomonas cellasea]